MSPVDLGEILISWISWVNSVFWVICLIDLSIMQFSFVDF